MLDKVDLGSVQENSSVGSKTHGEGTGDLKVSHFNKLAQHLSEMAQTSGGPTLRQGGGPGDLSRAFPDYSNCRIAQTISKNG